MSEEVGFCKWTHEIENQFHWATGCGKEFVLVESNPQKCGILFCPYCGAPVALPCEDGD